jgi:hypothetical protein
MAKVPEPMLHLPFRSLLELGFETQDIANAKGIHEADVYNTLAREKGVTFYNGQLGAHFIRAASGMK